MKQDIYERITGKIVADLENGVRPWMKPWNAEHAAYIGAWLKVLKNDKRAIFSAAAHAQKAADFLDGLQARERGPMAA